MRYVPRALLFLVLLGASLQAQVRDLYMVVDERVTLYLDRHLQQGNLQVGDVVEGTAHPVYRDWLKISLDGRSYDSRAKYYLARAKFREGIVRQRASMFSRIERDTDRIENARDEIWELRSAIAAIQFDSAVEFREKEVVSVDPGQGNATTTTNYRYRDKVSPSAAKRQVRKWQNDIDKLENQVAGWENGRRDDYASLAVLDYNRQDIERRFQAYASNRVSRLPQPYLVIAKTAKLYDGSHLVSQVKAGQIVLARLNRRSSRWLRVQVPNRVLDGRASSFSSRQDVEKDAVSRIARLRQYVADLQAGIDLAVAQEKQLRSLRVSLQYESRVTRVPLSIYPFAGNYPGRTFYMGQTTPNEATQMVDLGRARSVQRDWDDRLKAVRNELKRLRDRLDTARKDLALAQARAAEWSRRFRAIDPAEPKTGVATPLP